MIGTRLDPIDAPRLIRSKQGWWFIGNGTWHLLQSEQVTPEGVVNSGVLTQLERDGAFRQRSPSSFSLTVLPTTACNLGCGYCFQNTALDPHGGHSPLRIKRVGIEQSVIDATIRFASRRMEIAQLDRLYLLLFGGEPLLNPSGCLQLLSSAQGIGLETAVMTTNGVLLTAGLAKDLVAAGLTAAQVTFDGSKQDHDQIRVNHAGRGTFDTIVANVESAMANTNLAWNFRVNVSHRNFDRIDALFDEVSGRVDSSRCTMTFAWVGDAGFGYGNKLGRGRQVCDSFVDWSIRAVENGFRIMPPSMKTTCQICSTPGGKYGAVVNADGTLYSCWQSAGKPGFEVGNVVHGYTNQAVPDRWVTCGYEYAQADTNDADAFQDEVDGRVLDYLYTAGVL